MRKSDAIQWTRILVEGVVIAVSILPAFGIDAWWDGRKDRERETVYLAQLEEDLIATREDAVRSVESEATFGRMLDSLEVALYGDSETPVDSVAYWFENTLRSSGFEARNGALEALITSGDLVLLRDPELRRSLVRYAGRVDDARETYATFNDASLEALQSLNRRVDRAGIRVEAEGGTPVGGPIDWGLIAADPVVRGDLWTHGIAVSARRSSLERLVEDVDPVLERVREELDSRGVA